MAQSFTKDPNLHLISFPITISYSQLPKETIFSSINNRTSNIMHFMDCEACNGARAHCDECAICEESLTAGDSTLTHNLCRNTFHELCLKQWDEICKAQSQDTTCPFYRLIVSALERNGTVPLDQRQVSSRVPWTSQWLPPLSLHEIREHRRINWRLRDTSDKRNSQMRMTPLLESRESRR
jgi:hypothetical protein